MQDIKTLLEKYIPPHEITYSEVDQLDILGLKFQVAGVALKLETGLEAYGSSSSTTGSPLVYAAYECLERYVILSRGEKPLEGEEWKNSLSNGVALHETFELASQNAFLELAERNEILKSWYYNTPVQKLEYSAAENFSKEFCNNYELILVDFSTLKGLHVPGMFAFPKVSGLNMIYGFGCSRVLSEGIEKARKEFMSRLGFLWGEGPSSEETPKKSPHYHQEFYLHPENSSYIREWILGNDYPKKSIKLYEMKDIVFSNLTPAEWKKELWVIKAEAPDSIPLFFGKPHQNHFSFTHRCDIPHPII